MAFSDKTNNPIPDDDADDATTITTFTSYAASNHENTPPLDTDHCTHEACQREPDNLIDLIELIRKDGQEFPILEYPDGDYRYQEHLGIKPVGPQRQRILDTYFGAIRSGDEETFAIIIGSGVVTTKTKNIGGRSSLLAAVEAGNLNIVRQLIDVGANVNDYGITAGIPKRGYNKAFLITYRTPLQLAAEKGNLPMVKLLMEKYHADDSLIAPDGQHALRLAASNSHREVVQYLPSRRGGGWRRWKAKHHKAMRRAKKAAKKIHYFFEVMLWHIPKFFLWTVPEHLVIRPLKKGVRWLQDNHKELPTIIAELLKKVVKWLAKWMKKIPKNIWDLVKLIPSAMKELWKGVVHVIKKFPAAARVVWFWIWGGVKAIGTAIRNILTRLFSFIHTVLAAITTFFKNLTLQDISNGLKALLHAIFVDGPKNLWQWLYKFGGVSYKALKILFGSLGVLIWLLICGILWLLTYVPKKLAVILTAFLQSMGGGCKEVMIWFDPKRT